MGAYEFVALTDRGREQRGILEGDSARQVRHQLRERGWSALDVVPVNGQASALQSATARETLPTAERVVMARQLATLAKAGVPVSELLATVAEQTGRARAKRVLLGVRSRVVEGAALSDALAQFPRVFPPFFRATVAAGEQSGRLAEVLDRLADHLERSEALKQKLALSLVYPALVFTVAVGVIGLMMTYVVPEVVRVFTGLDQELPWFTRALIATSDAVRAWAGPTALVVLIAVVGLGFSLRFPAVRLAADRTFLALPIIGSLVRRLNSTRFIRALASLTASAVPLLEAVRLAAEVVPNRALQAVLSGVGRQIREGGTLSGGLKQTGQFTPLALNLIATGESGGRLPELLDRTATQQERELELGLATLVGVLEPLMIVLLGGVILAIVVAILLPIFQLNQLVVI